MTRWWLARNSDNLLAVRAMSGLVITVIVRFGLYF